jgi:hypothetical protein
MTALLVESRLVGGQHHDFGLHGARQTDGQVLVGSIEGEFVGWDSFARKGPFDHLDMSRTALYS